MKKDASLSADRVYRYWLSRTWGPGFLAGNPLVCIGLNPSTADETSDDATIRTLVAFARLWGHDGLLMLNLFAFRATDPGELRTTAFDPIGPSNDDVLRHNCRGKKILCAWGNDGDYEGRDKAVLELLKDIGATPMCLGTNKSGQPKHALYLARKTELVAL